MVRGEHFVGCHAVGRGVDTRILSRSLVGLLHREDGAPRPSYDDAVVVQFGHVGRHSEPADVLAMLVGFVYVGCASGVDGHAIL